MDYSEYKNKFSFRVESKHSQLGGIYKIQSVLDGRFYIGSAKNFWDRYSNHVRTVAQGEHKNIKLQRFIEKYGFDAVFFEVVEICEDTSKDNLIKREQYYLDTLQPFDDKGFNICRDAKSCHGVKRRKETILALIERNRGNNYTRGKKYGLESNIRKSKSAKPWIPVAQYDINGRFIRVFESDYIAAKELGIKEVKGITKVCQLKQKSIRGFIWRYAPDYICSNKIEAAKMGVLQFDLNKNLIKRYSHLKEIRDNYKEFHGDSIHKVCSGLAKTHKNFYWEYES